MFVTALMAKGNPLAMRADFVGPLTDLISLQQEDEGASFILNAPRRFPRRQMCTCRARKKVHQFQGTHHVPHC
jgi:hypothetical protein